MYKLNWTQHYTKTSNNDKLCLLGMASVKVGPSFPQWLRKQSILESLVMSDANITDMIPNWLSNITLFMRTLDLSDNKLVGGKIPLALQNLTLLQRLDLGENKLRDVFPTWISKKLQSLELLRLNANQFYGVIPLELCQISSLCWLNLAGNNLYGTIPRCFGNFSCMSSGGISEQRVESFMKEIPLEYVGVQILLLRIVDLSENKLVGRIPKELTKLVDLQYLNLSRNSLNGSIPKKLGKVRYILASQTLLVGFHWYVVGVVICNI